MNINALKKTLKSFDMDALNEILNQRDNGAFDQAWVTANESVPDGEDHPENNEIFSQISKMTNQHEICSYISDDINLLHRARIAEIESPFLKYLKQCYEVGIIPNDWHS